MDFKSGFSGFLAKSVFFIFFCDIVLRQYDRRGVTQPVFIVTEYFVYHWPTAANWAHELWQVQ